MKTLQQAYLMLLTVLLYIALAIPAQAVEIIVGDNDPSVRACTLADAITAANTDIATGSCPAGSDEDTIILMTDITLSAALPQISSTITIEGNDHFISGNNSDDVGSVLRIASTGVLTLNNGIVKGGKATKGGGMYNEGTVTLNNSTVSGNSVTTKASMVYLYGGGIYNEGTVTLNNSTVSGNSVTTTKANNVAYLYGGGIYNKGTITLANSTISDNSAHADAPDEAYVYGGGMYNDGTATLTNSTVSGNSAYASSFPDTPAYGGGIYNGGTVTLTNSTVSDNSTYARAYAYSYSYPYAYGGGMYNEGTITLIGSTVSGNSIDASNSYGTYAYGGGIYNKGTITLTNSTVSGNSADANVFSRIYGGGMYNEGTAMLNHSMVSGNSAIDNGGGIYNAGILTLTDSTVSSNSTKDSGGGIYNVDTVTLINSTVRGNSVKQQESILFLSGSNAYGGGVYNKGSVALTNSTVSDNSAGANASISGGAYAGGGGICNWNGTVTLTNSTISGNSTNAISSYDNAYAHSGGIHNFKGMVTLNSSTVSGNTAESSSEFNLAYANGGGIYNEYEGTVTLNNSLISGNTADKGNEVYKENGDIYTDSFNLFGHSGESNADAFVGFTPGASDVDATGNGGTALENILSLLEDNGGPTQTHALPEGSPAIDMAECSVDLITDQRGMSRPDGNGCDAGSFEFHFNHAPVADAGADQSAVQGETICFDGSNSTDTDGDLLTYSWILSAWPAGSGTELDDPTAETTCLVIDLPGTYKISLVVNDGLINSEPDSAEAVTTSSYPNAVSETLLETENVLNGLDLAVFKGKRKAEQRKKQLIRMINRALALTERGRYLRALELLRKGVFKRIDGCAISGQAHRNDWIQDCDAQEEVYLLVTEAIGYLEEVVSLPALIELLEQTGATVNGLDTDHFKKKRHQAKLVRHIDRAVELVGKLKYRKALQHLRTRALPRIDGCAKAGRPHKKDWIQDCAAQEQVYPLIMEVVGELKNTL